jgi:3-hydroxyacyl-CoA dehydrogenase
MGNKELRVTVIGAGVMGSAIAAHFANAGVRTRLLDIVPQGEERSRNVLAERAVAGLKDRQPAPLVHRKAQALLEPGNLEDDLEDAVAESDWVIEAVIEDVQVKRKLYERIERFRKGGTIVSSNTSTIPLKQLTEGRGGDFKKHFCIAHFFNPPRYMRLLELVGGKETLPAVMERAEHIGSVLLGKETVPCRDTPGFIANRIGCFWIAAGMIEAERIGLSVTDADEVMGKPFGMPKTGVFGLADLIGVDLIPLIAKAFAETLSANDPFLVLYKDAPAFIEQMIKDGYVGRKGKGGFYRLNKEGGGKVKEARDLKTGEYRKEEPSGPDSVRAAKDGLPRLMEHKDKGGEYARAVMGKTLAYAASLVPEIAASVRDVDRAMRFGYNWKYGPFELIDRMGADFLVALLERQGAGVPPLLSTAAKEGGFYKNERGRRACLEADGSGYSVPRAPEGSRMLEDYKPERPAVLKNASAALWDIGDGVACLEFRSKMNSVDPFILEMIEQAIERVRQDFKGLVIANDGDNFCVGANLGVLLFAANTAAWQEIEDILKRGQDAYMGLKYAPFPVVSAPAGMALGGGCELLLHSDAVQAHIETYAGLVEAGVGVVPAWGGCKEMLWRRLAKPAGTEEGGGMFGRIAGAVGKGLQPFNAMPVVKDVFETIVMAKVSGSAEEARDMGILRETDGVTMNRSRLLPDAKEACLRLAKGYRPPERREIRLPGKTALAALKMGVAAFVKKGVASEHDALIAEKLGRVVTGADASLRDSLTEEDVLKLEREAFMELIRHPLTLDRIEHMLENGKPLRN